MRLYLAHPTPLRREVREWQKAFEKRIEVPLTFFNPFYEGDYRDNIIEFDRKGIIYLHYKDKYSSTKLMNSDLRHISEQDGLLAILSNDVESYGTPMEIFYNSYVLKKPTFTVGSHYAVNHPFVLSLSDRVFRSLDQFEKFVNENKTWFENF